MLYSNIVGFIIYKVLILIIFPLLLKQEIYFIEKQTNACSFKALKDTTVVNWTWHSVNLGLLEIMYIVLFKGFFFRNTNIKKYIHFKYLCFHTSDIFQSILKIFHF